MQISNGVCIETRERVWVDGDPELAREFFNEVKESQAGKRYFSEFASSTNHERVIEAVWKLYPDTEYVSVSAFVDAIGTLLAAGELTPTHEPEASVPVAPSVPVPVDRNGRPLTQSQIDWKEMTEFATEKSMREINERKRIDPKFLAFIQTNLRRDMAQEIDGDARSMNPHLEQNATPTPSAMKNDKLVAFANHWRSMTADAVRKAKRFDINPLTAQSFIDDEAQAIKLRLL
jgi:hypothetical protein